MEPKRRNLIQLHRMREIREIAIEVWAMSVGQGKKKKHFIRGNRLSKDWRLETRSIQEMLNNSLPTSQRGVGDKAEEVDGARSWGL